ncbi:hypothetical protein LINGRAHAP2_LOCUS36070 [Linum grandiflorum]
MTGGLSSKLSLPTWTIALLPVLRCVGSWREYRLIGPWELGSLGYSRTLRRQLLSFPRLRILTTNM